MKDAFGIIVFLVMATFIVRAFMRASRAADAQRDAERLHWQKFGFRMIPTPLDDASRALSHILRWDWMGDTFAGTFDGQETHASLLWPKPSGRSDSGDGMRHAVIGFRQTARTPVFLLKTESALGNLSYVFQPRKEDSADIDFDFDAHFSSCYDLSSPEEASVRGRFTPAVTAYWGRLASSAPALATLSDGFRWCAESTGHWLLIYGPPPSSTDDLAAYLAGCKAAADSFTSGVVRPEAEFLCSIGASRMQIAAPMVASGIRSVGKAFLGLVLGMLLFFVVAFLFIWWQAHNGAK